MSPGDRFVALRPAIQRVRRQQPIVPAQGDQRASSDFMVICQGFSAALAEPVANIADPLLWLQRRKSQAFATYRLSYGSMSTDQLSR